MRNREDEAAMCRANQINLKNICFLLQDKNLIQGLHESNNIGYSEWTFNYKSQRVSISVGIGTFGRVIIHLKISLLEDLAANPTKTMMAISEKWQSTDRSLGCKKGLRIHAYASKDCESLLEAFAIALQGNHTDIVAQIEKQREVTFLAQFI